MRDKLLWWVMGLIASVITGGGGAWLTSMHNATIQHGEKIAVMEERIEGVQKGVDKIDRKMDRLLSKP